MRRSVLWDLALRLLAESQGLSLFLRRVFTFAEGLDFHFGGTTGLGTSRPGHGRQVTGRVSGVGWAPSRPRTPLAPEVL